MADQLAPNKTAEHSNITTQESCPDLDSVKPPKDHVWLSRDGEVRLRDLINSALITGSMPKDWKLFVDGFDAFQHRPVVEIAVIAPAAEGPDIFHIWTAAIIGWRPTVELDANDLHRRADAIWQTSAALDDARAEAADRTNFARDDNAARFVVHRMNEAEAALDQHCITLMGAARDWSRWMNLIPDDAWIVGYGCLIKVEKRKGAKK